MTSAKRILVVAHTHWDREWYHPAATFRRRLVALVDELLDQPPAAGESFLLDGQAILLDDYLAVRPDRAAELGALLRDGRLEAGPWYVLADELIPSGEALVRNLLAGRDALRAMRAQSPPVLYCPDSFGHPAALPDLAAGFGCDLVIVWRGYGGARWPAGDLARWTGTAGSQVLLHHLARDGYELGSSLPVGSIAAAERWRRLSPELLDRSHTGVALLLNGADHHARQRNHRDAVDALRAAAAPVSVSHASLREASDAIVRSARAAKLPDACGELRDSYGYTWALQGTLGTRAGQKRRNALAERLLIRDLEPWIALGADGGDDTARALLRTAWRTLLAGQPHDTLCGTSVDAVAASLDERHAEVEAQSVELRAEAIRLLTGHDSERARRESSAWRPAVLIRNPVARSRGGVVELRLAATLADVAVGPGSAARQGVPRRAPAWGVVGVPLQVLQRRERVELTESPRDYPDADLVAEARAVGWTEPIGGYAIESRLHGRADRGSVPNRVRCEASSLDNGLVRVRVSPTGVVRIEDLITGAVLEDAVALEDRVDVGDLYTPALRAHRSPPRFRRTRLVHRGPLRGELALEFGARAGAAVGQLRCRISLVLDADVRFVRVRITGWNGVSDHRLRLLVHTAVEKGETLADAAFHPVSRRGLELGGDDAAMEHVVPTAPLHRWVSRFSPSLGVTVVSDGLAEYESLADGTIAVTLVRAVGALSRADLPERPGHAGWPAPTPAAQSRGPFEAELAIAMHGADSPEQRDDIERIAEDVLLPLTGETRRSNLHGRLSTGGLTLRGSGLAFSAMMPARHAGWVVLRCVNRREWEVRGEWRTTRRIAEAARARLDETVLSPIDSISEDRRGVSFDAAPREIVTLVVRWDAS
jgi:alpha-mannosidase